MENIAKLKEGKIEDLINGKRIKIMKYQNKHVEQLAYDNVLQKPDDWVWKGKNKQYWLEFFKENIPKQKTWKDYAIYLVNSFPTQWVKEGWAKKLAVSEKHWAKTGSATFETIRDALWVLHYVKDKSYLEFPEDYTNKIWWDQCGNAEISRMPILKFFKVFEDSPENQAAYYINGLISDLTSENEDQINHAMEELQQNKMLSTILFGENGTIDNITTLPNNLRYLQHPIASIKNLNMPPSCGDIRMFVLGGEYKIVERERNSCDIEQLVTALQSTARRVFHDQLKNSPSYKRIVVAVLRNDSCLTYMGFAPTSEQMKVRAQGLAAFSQKQEEREKAMKEFKKLQEKIKKESEEIA